MTADHRRNAGVIVGIAVLWLCAAMIPCSAQEARLEPIYAPGQDWPHSVHGRNAGVWNAGGRSDTLVGLLMERLSYRIHYPLQPFVYFDAGSANIPERYVRFPGAELTAEFADTAIPGGLFEQYYHVLNIVGRRMREAPGATIELVGDCSGESGLGETHRLAVARAHAVRRYLVDIWRVDSARIRCSAAREESRRLASWRDTLHVIEQRNVEIRSEDWAIVAPISQHDVRVGCISGPMAFRMPPCPGDIPVVRREIEILWHGKPWHVLRNISPTDTISPVFTWRRDGAPAVLPDDDPANLPDDESPYTARMVLHVVDGSVLRSPDIEIPVTITGLDDLMRRRGIHVVTETFWLPFFRMLAVNPGPLNERIMNEFACSAVRSGSRVEIVGGTDQIGLEEYNLRLSRLRAGIVEGYMRHCVSAELNATFSSTGLGEQSPFFNTDRPEGRAYCRAVCIRIVHPL